MRGNIYLFFAKLMDWRDSGNWILAYCISGYNPANNNIKPIDVYLFLYSSRESGESK